MFCFASSSSLQINNDITCLPVINLIKTVLSFNKPDRTSSSYFEAVERPENKCTRLLADYKAYQLVNYLQLAYYKVIYTIRMHVPIYKIRIHVGL